ncbi:MAG: hypothetical protein GY757_12435, partial [bacterium]|nr:hypothetical protein [bacterium]
SLPLNSVPLNSVDAILKENGVIARVKDLFSLKNTDLDSSFKDGFLVENLKTALHVFARSGVDVVTLDAETITKDGLLVRNRDKGILDVIDEIRAIDEKKSTSQKNADVIKLKLDVEKRKQPELARNLESSRSDLRAMEKKSMQLKSSLDSLKKNRDNNLKRVEFTQSEIQLLLAEKEKLQDQFEIIDIKNSELEDSFNGLSQRREQFREEVQLLKEDINRVEKDYLQKENAINLVKEKINSSNYTIKNLKTTKIKLANNISNDEQEILKLTSEIAQSNDKEESQDKELKEWVRLKNELEAVVQKQEKEFNSYNGEIRNSTTQLNAKRKTLEELKEEKNRVEINLSSIKKDLVQLEDLAFKELNDELVNLVAVPELLTMGLDELESHVDSFNERLIKMRDSNRLNFSAESEYELLTKDYTFLLTQKQDVVNSIQDMNDAIAKIDAESRVSFNEAFSCIKENFEKNFQILFEGGEAELSLIDPDNVLESGLEIKAQPPGKRLLSLKLLSGGEKTLTSLAFLFALFEYKPSPFCVFDEVDASLDEANIQRFLKFLHKLKEKTQFLIITHNFKTMEEADYLYGISMNEPGISTVYSMKMTGKGKFEKA